LSYRITRIALADVGVFDRAFHPLHNVFGLIEPYSAVMLVSVVVFSAAIAALYFWTKGKASDAPAPNDGPIVEEATYR